MHLYPSVSPYVYSLNDPIGKRDPDGRFVWGAVIGGLADYAMQSVQTGNWGTSGKDWGSIAISAGAGLASGGLSVATKAMKAVKVAKALNVAGNAAINVTEGYAKSDGDYTVTKALGDATVGVVSSKVGDAVENSINSGLKGVAPAAKVADNAKFKATGVSKNPKASASRKAKYKNTSKKAEADFDKSVDNFWKSTNAENVNAAGAAGAATNSAGSAAEDEAQKR